jgi:hypothetical protein
VRHRRRSRRSATAAGLTLLVTLALVGGGGFLAARWTGSDASPSGAPAATDPLDPADAAPPYPVNDPEGAETKPSYGANAPPAYPSTGPGTYAFATGSGPVFGSAGPVRRYRVAVETGAPVSVAEFTTLVDATLGDGRSWIAGRDVRLRRVPAQAGYDFTVMLVTPGTAYRLCASGGLDIRWRGQPYTSCRVGARVVINLARYLTGVPGYGAPLAAYRQYTINHEVGHALGHPHELCPGRGRRAPVMQQQTFGLRGCVAYAWPYRAGRRYAGPVGESHTG